MTCLCDTHLTTQAYIVGLSLPPKIALRIAATELIQCLNYNIYVGPIEQAWQCHIPRISYTTNC